MDLLTTIMHEIGNFLCYHDVPVDQPPAVLMTALMPTNVRRIPAPIVESPLSVTPTSLVAMPAPVADAPNLLLATSNVVDRAVSTIPPQHAAPALWATMHRTTTSSSGFFLRRDDSLTPANPTIFGTAAANVAELRQLAFVENLLRRSTGGRLPHPVRWNRAFVPAAIDA